MFNNSSLAKVRYYDTKNNRLVYIKNEATPEMWHSRWELDEANLRNKLAKKDKRVVKITSRYLKPQDGIILEGGCGYGGKVNSLMQAGYNVIGIDFDHQTVSFLNTNVPELDIRLGNVKSLQLDDSSVSGYWSLGVIEHFYYGFEDIAQEMVRVIKPGGYLFLSHPYMSPLRKAKARLGLYPHFSSQEKPRDFYQFALDHKFVAQTMKNLGFEFCLFKKGPGLLGFNEEVPLSPLLALYEYQGKNLLVKGIRYLVSKAFSPVASHSCLMVFKCAKDKT